MDASFHSFQEKIAGQGGHAPLRGGLEGQSPSNFPSAFPAGKGVSRPCSERLWHGLN